MYSLSWSSTQTMCKGLHILLFPPSKPATATAPNWDSQRRLSTAALVDNYPRAFRITNLSVCPALRMSPMPLLTSCHNAHGISGDVPAGPSKGRGTFVAPTDSTVQAAGELRARLCFHTAVFGCFPQGLDLALDGFGEGSVSKVVAALGSLFCGFGQLEALER